MAANGEAAIPSSTGPGKSVRSAGHGVFCIGELSTNARILHTAPLATTSKSSNATASLQYVRLQYTRASEFASNVPSYNSSSRLVSHPQPPPTNSNAPETFRIYAIPSGVEDRNSDGSLGDFIGVIDARHTRALNEISRTQQGRPARIRMKACIKLSPVNEAWLPLKILIFVPRVTDIQSISASFVAAGTPLQPPSTPYNPSDHLDRPPYAGPQQPSQMIASFAPIDREIVSLHTALAELNEQCTLSLQREANLHFTMSRLKIENTEKSRRLEEVCRSMQSELELFKEENSRLQSVVSVLQSQLESVETGRRSILDDLSKESGKWLAKHENINARRESLLEQITTQKSSPDSARASIGGVRSDFPLRGAIATTVATAAANAMWEAQVLFAEMDACKSREDLALQKVKQLEAFIKTLEAEVDSASNLSGVGVHPDRFKDELQVVLASNWSDQPLSSPNLVTSPPIPLSLTPSPAPTALDLTPSTFHDASSISKLYLDHEEAKRKASDLESEFNSLKIRTEKKQSEADRLIETLQSERDRLLLERDELRSHCREIEKSSLDASEYATKARDAFQALENVLEEHLGETRSDRDALPRLINSLKAEKVQLGKEKEKLEQHNSTLHQEKVDLMSQMLALEQQKADLLARTVQAETKHSHLDRQVNELEAEKLVLKKTIDGYEKEQSQSDSSWRRRVEESLDRLDKRKRDEDTVGIERAKRTKVEEQNSSLSFRVIDLQSQLGTSRSDADKLKAAEADIKQLKDQIELDLFSAYMNTNSDVHARRLTVEGFAQAVRKLEKKADQKLLQRQSTHQTAEKHSSKERRVQKSTGS